MESELLKWFDIEGKLTPYGRKAFGELLTEFDDMSSIMDSLNDEVTELKERLYDVGSTLCR